MTRTLLAVVALVSVTGCSIFLTHGPSDQAAAQKSAPDCTTSMTLPTVDAVIAAVITLGMISSISSKNTQEQPADGTVASGFIIAGAAGASALIGHARVSKCRRATEAFTATYYGQQPGYPYAQQGYGYPQQPPPAPYPQQPYPQQYPAPQQYPTAAPQQYPAQPYPTTTQPYPAQPYPQQQPQPVTSRPPIAAPTSAKPVATPNPVVPRPVAKPPVAARPAPAKPDPALGTEGDVCTAHTDCASGLSCTGNVCLKK